MAAVTEEGMREHMYHLGEATFWQSVLDWLKSPGISIAAVIASAFILVRAVKFALHRTERRLVRVGDDLVPSEAAKRGRTISAVLGSLASVVVWTVAVLVVFDRLGIKTSSIIASVGILGVAIGFGAQSLAKDLVSGFFILAEGQFGVGDVIRAQIAGATITGKVERVTLRTTIVRGTDGEFQVVPNGELRVVANLSKDWARVVLDVPVAPAQIAAATTAMREVAASIKSDPDWEPLLLSEPEVLGVEELGKDEAALRFSVRTRPLKQWDVSREVRRRIAAEFAANGISGEVNDDVDSG
ncbi:MAG: mechanosensitive ion channel protein MscS [Acidobacteria bacterium]|nr:MAG: mechanosensitive ion channel protein MscS [Acidobacteriota bacterium]